MATRQLASSLSFAAALATAGVAVPSALNAQAANQKAWVGKRNNSLYGTAKCTVNLIGDSTQGLVGSAGSGTAGGQPTSTAAALVKRLNARAGFNWARSDGFWGCHFSTGSAFTTFAAYDTRWTFAAGGWAGDTVILAGGSLKSQPTNTSAATFQAATAYDRVRLILRQVPNGGTLRVSSASGGTQDIVTAGSTSMIDVTVNLTRGTGLLSLTPVAASTAGIYIVAVELWDSTIGQCIVRDMAFSGSTTTSFGRSATYMATMVGDWSNFCFTLNDANSSLTVSNFVTNLTELTTGYSGGVGTITLSTENESSASWMAMATLDRQRAMAQAIRDLGRQNNWPVLDFATRWGTYDQMLANGLISADPHPNVYAYADKADVMFNAMMA